MKLVPFFVALVCVVGMAPAHLSGQSLTADDLANISPVIRQNILDDVESIPIEIRQKIYDVLFWRRIAFKIEENCSSIHVSLKELSKLESIFYGKLDEVNLNSVVYNRFWQFLPDAKINERVEAFLIASGAVEGSAESFCDFGRKEILKRVREDTDEKVIKQKFLLGRILE